MITEQGMGEREESTVRHGSTMVTVEEANLNFYFRDGDYEHSFENGQREHPQGGVGGLRSTCCARGWQRGSSLSRRL